MKMGLGDRLASREETSLLALPEEKNPYVQAFWKWWPSLVDDLIVLRLTGGEPLLQQGTFKLLDWFDKTPKPKLQLVITSNFSLPTKILSRFFSKLHSLLDNQKIGSFLLHVSVDSIGKRAEYIRTGLNFKLLNNNIERYLKEFPRAELAFICTFGCFSVTSLSDYLDWIIDLKEKHETSSRKIYLDVPKLLNPNHLSIRVLPSEYQNNIKTVIKKLSRLEKGKIHFSEEVKKKLQQMLVWMQQPLDVQLIERQRYYLYCFMVQQRNFFGKRFCDIFPEMSKFYKECKQIALTNVKWRG